MCSIPMGELIHFDVVLTLRAPNSIDMAHPGNKNGKDSGHDGNNKLESHAHDVDDLEEILGKGKSRIQCT